MLLILVFIFVILSFFCFKCLGLMKFSYKIFKLGEKNRIKNNSIMTGDFIKESNSISENEHLILYFHGSNTTVQSCRKIAIQLHDTFRNKYKSDHITVFVPEYIGYDHTIIKNWWNRFNLVRLQLNVMELQMKLKFLRKEKPFQSITLIGHSYGCMFALRCLELFKKQMSNTSIHTFILSGFDSIQTVSTFPWNLFSQTFDCDPIQILYRIHQLFHQSFHQSSITFIHSPHDKTDINKIYELKNIIPNQIKVIECPLSKSHSDFKPIFLECLNCLRS